ncbi:MAG: DUF2344 domain-containing protein [Phycisphaerae bacterium]
MTAAAVIPHPMPPPPAADPGVRAAVLYSLGGDLRFLSHRDELRMLARAMTRAAWPLRYSKGYNPQPRIALPLPRSVGMASDCQWALADLDPPADSGSLASALARQLPAGIEPSRVACPVSRHTPHAVLVEYRVRLHPEHIEAVRVGITPLLGARQRVIERVSRRRPDGIPVDLRRFLEGAWLEDDVLGLRLRIEKQCTVKPTEIIAELGLPPDAYRHRVCRVQVVWDKPPEAPPGPPATKEGTSFGHQESST